MYSIKDIYNLFGITKKTIELYMDPEKDLKYIPYRTKKEGIVFTEDEVCLIWFVKTLVEMGYSHSEIKEIIPKYQNGEDYDFSLNLDKKIKLLKNQITKNKESLAVAETIKFSGRIPIKKGDNILKINEFLDYVKKSYTFGSEEKLRDHFDNFLYSSGADKDLPILESLGNLFSSNEYKLAYEIDGFYKTLSNLRNLDVNNIVVQSVVQDFYDFTLKHKNELGLPQDFDEIVFVGFYDLSKFGEHSDIYKVNSIKFTEKGISFVSDAISTFALHKIHKKIGLGEFINEN